jgi:hypothetical protein
MVFSIGIAANSMGGRKLADDEERSAAARYFRFGSKISFSRATVAGFKS